MSALGNLFSDIAGAIREKTGETGTMKPAQFPEKILGIQGGGSADVRYVTFMSHDGTVEYGKKAVAVGDDCADPIKRGVFNTPTKDSTDQFNFTFVGWSKIANGALDSNALKSVGEDRTVYAAYASVLRHYTVTYYDGDTLLKTESVAYGSAPVGFMPEKKGFGFDRWEPELSAVYSEVSYYAQWVEFITFANGSWADIAAICEKGQASSAFAIGDEKMIPVTIGGSTYSYKAKIAGINHDDLSDGSGKAGISVILFTVPDTLYTFLDSGTIGEKTYADSDLRNSIVNFANNSFPAALVSVVKPVTKGVNSYHSTDETYTYSNIAEKFWAPAIEEVKSGDTSATTGGSLYPLFETDALTSKTNAVSFVNGENPCVSPHNKGVRLRNIVRGLSGVIRTYTSGSINAAGMNAGDGAAIVVGFCI